MLALCGHDAPSIRTSAKPALMQARSRLLPDSQSGITSRKCGLGGRPRGFRVPFGTGPQYLGDDWGRFTSPQEHKYRRTHIEKRPRKTFLLQWGVCLRHHVRLRRVTLLADVKARVKGRSAEQPPASSLIVWAAVVTH